MIFFFQRLMVKSERIVMWPYLVMYDQKELRDCILFIIFIILLIINYFFLDLAVYDQKELLRDHIIFIINYL